MLTCLQDEGSGFFLGLAGDGGQFINREIGEVVTGVDVVVGQFGNQFGGDAVQITQILRTLFGF